MITGNERLAVEFRDSELWLGDIPANYAEGKCSKCGESVNDEETISFLIDNAHGIEYYAYHKKCVNNTLNNASLDEARYYFKSKPKFYGL